MRILSGILLHFYIGFFSIAKKILNLRMKKTKCVQCGTPPLGVPVSLISLAQRSTTLHSLMVAKRCARLLLYSC